MQTAFFSSCVNACCMNQEEMTLQVSMRLLAVMRGWEWICSKEEVDHCLHLTRARKLTISWQLTPPWFPFILVRTSFSFASLSEE